MQKKVTQGKKAPQDSEITRAKPLLGPLKGKPLLGAPKVYGGTKTSPERDYEGP